MKRNLAVAMITAIVSSSAFAQYVAPTRGLSKDYRISTDKKDADKCPLITATNTGTKPFRLIIQYTHSGTTLGNSPSSETHTLTELNFRPGETRDLEINPGANCGKPNRLTIDDVKAELY